MTRPTQLLPQAMLSGIRPQGIRPQPRSLTHYSASTSQCQRQAEHVPALPVHRCRHRCCARSRDQPEFLGSTEEAEEEQTSDEPASPPRTPLQSRLADSEVLLFLYQLELDATLNRMLTYENYDRATEVRQTRARIDELFAQLQAQKRGLDSSQEAQESDYVSKGISLQARMQEAIADERYGDAAALRDELKKVQEVASAAADRDTLDRRRLETSRELRLGQRVTHRQRGFRGLICGWDSRCVEDEEWQTAEGVNPLQPFYHVLVDQRDVWPGTRAAREQARLPFMAYVPQELLDAPQGTESWVSKHGAEPFAHPWCMQLFLGKDDNGDYLPCRQLRDKYRQERQDVHPKNSSSDSSP